MDDVFISYGRAESKVFATKLNERLAEKGYKVWFDQEDIPLGVDFQEQINSGIEKAHNFIFIIAPHALKSEYCLKEVELAIRLNKRIIPILHIEPTEQEVWDKMHPTVGKLNWIYVRDKLEEDKPQTEWKAIDDFDKGFEGLLQIVESNKDYIQIHTKVLIAALNWNKHRREEEYLLVGTDRVEAEEWLTVEFKDKQAPTTPTGLHAEFICESKELANNHLTDVFFSYHKEDDEQAVRFHHSLTMSGITTWTKETDIRAGSKYMEEAQKGIRKNSNFLFFISEHSIQSDEQQEELSYALELNKRIVPLQLDKVDEKDIPESIRNFYRIDFTEKYDENYDEAIHKLLSVVKKDKAYFQLHRDLTVKAYEWEYRNNLQTLLLNGFDLENAQHWRDENTERAEDNAPTPLQLKYIEESTSSRPTVFISYGRKHSKEFATKLHLRLAEKGFDVWFDQEDIPLGVDFQKQIDDGIEKGDNFIFIISPHSIKSQYCLKEVVLAVKLNKRIIPLLHIEPSDCWEQMHPVIEKLNWIYFEESKYDFEEGFKGLYELMVSHTGYVRQHTSILTNALTWIRNQKDDDLLLSGIERQGAEEWLKTDFKKDQPPCIPTDLHAEYICESKEHANKHLTDVFLCYSEKETEIPIRFHYALMQKANTTWSKETDVKPGEDYAEAAKEGVEKNSNLLYFISQKTLSSATCSTELEYAKKLNKRIIPILLENTDKKKFPKEIKGMFVLDLTDNSDVVFNRVLAQLITIVNKNQEYYKLHRDLLIKALDWENGGEQPKKLLYGFDLESSVKWIEESEEMREKPTSLQRRYIDKSSTSRTTIFISYGRKHSKDFATRLHEGLTEEGLDVWFDQNDIPLGVDFQNQIDEGIEKADNFIFVISPHSIKSVYCLKEIVLAIKLNKRIIPLLHIEPSDCWDKMHPVIEKLNWIYFKEGENDFDESFKGLVNLIHLHSDYVNKHTFFLNRALKWERNANEQSLLLTGKNRQDSEKWLMQKFIEDQPPCVPSVLHAEYICTSKKFANNMMTDAFFSYARPDAEILAIVRDILTKKGVTTWLDTSDIKSGSKFADAINKGIEQADNFILLISPESMDSKYCLMEIEHVLKLNKRIIPLLVRKTDLDTIPEAIRSIQYIDFSDNFENIESTSRNEKTDFDRDMDELVNELHKDEEYHDSHKIFTTKALKWEKQSQNQSILLRGFELEKAEAWFKVGQKKEINQPTELHDLYIATSRAICNEQSPEVLICHSNEDFDFAFRLNDMLQTQGKVTWFDISHFPTDVDVDVEIKKGIENADNIVFVLSPNALKLGYLLNAIQHANELNKKILALEYQNIPEEDLPKTLSEVNLLNFKPREKDFYDSFSELLRGIDVDREYTQIHTRIQRVANEWETRGRELAVLLKGSGFAIAEAWLEEALEKNKSPRPTKLQQELIQCSKDDIERIERERKEYTEKLKKALEEAEVAKKEAERETKNAKSLLFASQVPKVTAYNPTKAVQIALEAYKIAQPHPPISVINTLNESYYVPNDQNKLFYNKSLDCGDNVLSFVQFSPDGSMFLTTSDVIDIWDKAGTLIASCKGHEGDINSAQFSPCNKYILTSASDKTAKLWDTHGNLITDFKGHPDNVSWACFSPDSKIIVTASKDNTAKIWTASGKFIVGLNSHTDHVNKAIVSPDGKMILTASGEDLPAATTSSVCGVAKLWDIEGNELATFERHSWGIVDIDFSPESDLVLTASNDSTAMLWDLEGNFITQFVGHRRAVRSCYFSPDGTKILSASSDGTARLWNLKGDELAQFVGHKQLISEAHFIDNGNKIVTASYDCTAKLWDIQGNMLANCGGHSAAVVGADVSPDGSTIVTVSWDKTAKLWNLKDIQPKTIPSWTDFDISQDGTALLTSFDTYAEIFDLNGNSKSVFKGHNGDIIHTTFSKDGKRIITAASDKRIIIWDVETKEIIKECKLKYIEFTKIEISPNEDNFAVVSTDHTVRIFNFEGKEQSVCRGHNGEIIIVRYSPDGKYILTASTDNRLILWNLKGEIRAELKGHTHRVNDAKFSPDSKKIISASTDTTAKLWDINGKMLTSLDGHYLGVLFANFSQDSQKIITSSQDNTAKLWDIEGNVLTTFVGHKNFVSFACFNNNCDKIVTTSWDNTAKLWNTEGECISSFIGHNNAVIEAAFDPSDKKVVTFAWDKKVRIWNVQEGIADWLEGENIPKLSDKDRKQFRL